MLFGYVIYYASLLLFQKLYLLAKFICWHFVFLLCSVICGLVQLATFLCLHIAPRTSRVVFCLRRRLFTIHALTTIPNWRQLHMQSKTRQRTMRYQIIRTLTKCKIVHKIYNRVNLYFLCFVCSKNRIVWDILDGRVSIQIFCGCLKRHLVM